ncbi:hypothetical protein [Paenibacillus beijingensis]|nr:hypothetical protein [Paenibacillus beijingensis]
MTQHRCTGKKTFSAAWKMSATFLHYTEAKIEALEKLFGAAPAAQHASL